MSEHERTVAEAVRADAGREGRRDVEPAPEPPPGLIGRLVDLLRRYRRRRMLRKRDPFLYK